MPTFDIQIEIIPVQICNTNAYLCICEENKELLYMFLKYFFQKGYFYDIKAGYLSGPETSLRTSFPNCDK
jgi:hypothetical protein